MKLIGVIVTYNRLSYLKTTIAKSLEFGFDEIIIINNASNDGSIEYLATLTEKKIKVLNLPENSGGAGGFYAGLSYVREKFESGWVCLFDDDSYPDSIREVVINRLSTFDKSVGSVAASVFLPNGSISEMNRVSTNPFKSLRALCRAIRLGRAGFHVKDEDYYGSVQEIDTSSFVGCFIQIESLIKSNVLPRKDFFIYGDDILFTYQLTQAGFKNYFAPDIKFIHDCNSYNHNVVYTSLWKVYYLYRNGLEVYKNISGWLFPLVAVRYLCIWLKRVVHYGPNKKKYLKVMWLGIKDWAFKKYDRKFSEVNLIINAIE